MVTAVHKKFTYCSPSTSSGKQKKSRSTSQPRFRSENTLATIGADQILLTLQRLANNSNYKNSNKAKRKSKTVQSPCKTRGKTNHSTEKCYYGANAANRPPPGQGRPERQNPVQERANQYDSNETTQAAAQKMK